MTDLTAEIGEPRGPAGSNSVRLPSVTKRGHKPMLHSEPDRSQDTSKRIRRPYKRIIIFIAVFPIIFAFWYYTGFNLRRQVEAEANVEGIKDVIEENGSMTNGREGGKMFG